jgi:hypothetical protein
MLERIYDTFRGIIYYEMPKDYNGKAISFDRPITAWYYGERDVKNTNLSVTFKGGTGQLKDIALGLQEFTYKIVVEVDSGADNIEISERLTQETVRLMLSILRKHRRVWIVDICPICQKFTLSPIHFLNDHNDILDGYVTAVIADYNALWAETHPASIPPATLPDSAKATEAFLRMFEDVRNDVTVTGLSATARKNIKRMQSDFVEPIRILYDVSCNSNTFSDDSTGKALQKGGSIEITAKELVKQYAYGPDNVSTSAIRFNL